MYRRCGFRHERKLRALGISTIAGIDEAGRGALAGPVVAAAVILPEKFRHRRLNDSKQLLPERRAEIYEELRLQAEKRGTSIKDLVRQSLKIGLLAMKLEEKPETGLFIKEKEASGVTRETRLILA